MYNKPFVVSKKKGETFIKYYSGKVKRYDLLSDINEDKEQIFVVPFSSIKERGFDVSFHNKIEENGEKIISIIIDEKREYNYEEFNQTFEEKDSLLDNDLKEYFSEKEYKNIVNSIVKNEIGSGEGSNFLIAQKIEGKISDFDIEVALSIFKRLLEGDYGTYLHFIFFDGEKIFIGASPERNVSIEPLLDSDSKEKYKVRMNPISGTFKKRGYENYLDFKGDFLKFLNDKKEINELFMATDEELKMMSSICTNGGMIVGPILKEMANLIHTEYLLSGNSSLNKIDILRKSMWASTVVGSPIESAYRVLKKYENFSRKYYAGAICHIENDSLDSSIMIRTMQLDTTGKLEIYVGASLVKDSVPDNEYSELQIKLKGLLNSINSKKGQLKKNISFLKEYYLDDEVQEILQNRNANLSKTWFFKQKSKVDSFLLKNKKIKILIINNEDDFTNMLAHLLRLIGFEIKIKKYSDLYSKEDVLLQESIEGYNIVLIGPGPGNPISDDYKILKNLEIIDYLDVNNKKYFGICLGHQLICRYKNINVKKKKITTQGEQIDIDLYGDNMKVAFYNTYAGFYEPQPLLSKKGGIQEFSKKQDGEIYALRSDNFFGLQFHPESILTQYGIEILKNEIFNLLKK